MSAFPRLHEQSQRDSRCDDSFSFGCCQVCHPPSVRLAMAASTAPWMKRISSTLLIGLAQLLAEKGIRANAVAPGPIWTPLIPSTMPPDSVVKFGSNVPMKRPGQPAELATTYVMLADPLS